MFAAVLMVSLLQFPAAGFVSTGVNTKAVRVLLIFHWLFEECLTSITHSFDQGGFPTSSLSAMFVP